MKPTQTNYRSVSFKNFLSGSILESLLYRPTPVYCAPTGHNTQHKPITVRKCIWTLGQYAKQRQLLLRYGYIYTLQSFQIPFYKLGHIM